MAFADLSPADHAVLRAALRAAAAGPFFPDREFEPLFGVPRARVADLAEEDWNDDAEGSDAGLACHNALNHLTGYPHGIDGTTWDAWLPVDGAGLLDVWARWKRTAGSGPHPHSA